ncbi:hypothetical protein [Roseomonas marmotae]|uniref:hypothetical protein n=1 Tax=Roseomonas marmotae TaxID=2768161 RepID=UPI001AD79685|nr:hypothetical protein [Roseomonas marmotae]
MTTETRPEARTPELCLPPALRKPRLRRWEAAEYLKLIHGIEVAPATLSKWATIGGGPVFQKINRTPVYPKDGENGLDDWAIRKLGVPRSSTSEVA